MIFLMKYQFLIILFLLITFILTLIFNKRMIAVSISIFLLLLGAGMFIAGFTIVLGWKGMAITIAGIIYGAAGFITIMMFSIKEYFNSRKSGF